MQIRGPAFRRVLFSVLLLRCTRCKEPGCKSRIMKRHLRGEKMNTNSAYESLLSRRSVRSYTEQNLNEEQIDRIIQAGQYAPSAMGRQPLAFLAVQNPEIRNRLSELNAQILAARSPHKRSDPFYGAPCVIAVLADRAVSTRILDGAAAMENMLLAAEDLGLGSCWINRALEVFEMKEGQEILKSAGFEQPEQLEGIGFVICGYPDKEPGPAAERRSEVRKLL